jgi:hypothetical protein
VSRLIDRLLIVTLVGLMAYMAWQVKTAEGAVKRACAKPSQAKWLRLPVEYPHFYRALKIHFGRSWREAAIVAYGEGSWHPFATNGQYRGTFQMGEWARSRFGHSHTLPGQVKYAARYWRTSGWSGWECKPW